MAKKPLIKNKVTKDTLIAVILKNPKSEKIVAKYNLPCLSCPLAAFELGELKIGEVCQRYGIDLKKLLNELNEKTEK